MSHKSPNWSYGYTPLITEWNDWWAVKQDWAPPLDVLANLQQGNLIGNATGQVGQVSIGVGLSLSAGGVLSFTGELITATDSNFAPVGGTLHLANNVTITGTMNAGTLASAHAILTGGSITGLPTPSAASDAVPKTYVDTKTTTLTGDITGSGSSSIATTLGSVYVGGAIGGTGSVVTGLTANTKGLVTAATTRPSGGQITQTATAGSTVTVTPTLGIENYWVAGPATGGTIPAIVLGAGTQPGQKMVVNISNGATGATWPSTFSNANYSTDLPATAITSTAGKRATLNFILNSGTTLWDFEAITQGFSP